MIENTLARKQSVGKRTFQIKLSVSIDASGALGNALFKAAFQHIARGKRKPACALVYAVEQLPLINELSARSIKFSRAGALPHHIPACIAGRAVLKIFASLAVILSQQETTLVKKRSIRPKQRAGSAVYALFKIPLVFNGSIRVKLGASAGEQSSGKGPGKLRGPVRKERALALILPGDEPAFIQLLSIRVIKRAGSAVASLIEVSLIEHGFPVFIKEPASSLIDALLQIPFIQRQAVFIDNPIPLTDPRREIALINAAVLFVIKRPLAFIQAAGKHALILKLAALIVLLAPAGFCPFLQLSMKQEHRFAIVCIELHPSGICLHTRVGYRQAGSQKSALHKRPANIIYEQPARNQYQGDHHKQALGDEYRPGVDIIGARLGLELHLCHALGDCRHHLGELPA